MAYVNEWRLGQAKACVKRDPSPYNRPMEEGSTPLRTSKHGVLVELRVRPGSSRGGMAGMREGRLLVAVHAPPEGGRANREALKTLAEVLGVPTSALELVRGASSRDKTVLLRGMDLAEVEVRLRKYLTIK